MDKLSLLQMQLALPQDPRHRQVTEWAVDEIERLRADNAALVEALEKIDNPIWHMRASLPAGAKLDGYMASQLSNDPHYLKGIARDALNKYRTESAEASTDER